MDVWEFRFLHLGDPAAWTEYYDAFSVLFIYEVFHPEESWNEVHCDSLANLRLFSVEPTEPSIMQVFFFFRLSCIITHVSGEHHPLSSAFYIVVLFLLWSIHATPKTQHHLTWLFWLLLWRIYVQLHNKHTLQTSSAALLIYWPSWLVASVLLLARWPQKKLFIPQADELLSDWCWREGRKKKEKEKSLFSLQAYFWLQRKSNPEC